MKTDLVGMTAAELTEWAKAAGLPAFRGKQIFQWIHRGADFDEMRNLPAPLRETLKKTAVAQPVHIRTFGNYITALEPIAQEG